MKRTLTILSLAGLLLAGLLPFLPGQLSHDVGRSLTRPVGYSITGWGGSILNLPLHSWWTAADLNGDYQTIDNQGTSGAGVATLGSGDTADSNDPTYFDWQDSSETDPLYVYLDGSSGSYISQEDEAGNSVTGASTWEIDFSLDDYTSGTQTLFGKYDTVLIAFWFYVNSAGHLGYRISEDGTAYEDNTISGPTVVNGQRIIIRFKYDPSNTSLDYAYSTDGGLNYTDVSGSPITTTSLFDSNLPLQIGARAGGVNAKGKFYSFSYYSGVGASKTLVSHWKASDMGDSGGPDSAPTPLGDWTLNGGYSVAKPSGNYVYLPGSSGNYISSTNPDLTGDQTWTIWCAADDWASGASQSLFAVHGGAAELSYLITLLGTGAVRFHTSADGSTAPNDISTALPFVDGEWYGLRIKYDASAGQAEVLISSDGINFTSHDTLSGLTTSLYSAAADLNMSVFGGWFYGGKIGWATIHDNATGTGDPVWRFDAGSSLMTQTGYTDPYSGDAITINRSSSGLKSTWVTRPVFVLDSAASTYLEIADHPDLDIDDEDVTVWFYGRVHGAQNSSGYYIQKRVGTSGPGYVLYNSSTNKYLRWYMYDTGVNQTSATTPVYGDHESTLLVGTKTSTGIKYGIDNVYSAEETVAIGDTSNTGTVRIGITGIGSLPIDAEVWAWGLVKGTALTENQLAKLKDELDARLGGTTGGYFLLLFIPLFRRRRKNVVELFRSPSGPVLSLRSEPRQERKAA